MNDFDRRLRAVETRNARVESDKAWEVSLTRRFFIAAITYLFIGLYLSWLDVAEPWLNAVVPMVGFMLSTLALRSIKTFWSSKRRS
jgi:hypothetical protein